MTTINDTPVLHLPRLEGAATFIAGLAGYFALGGNWYLLAFLHCFYFLDIFSGS